jgi:hypothetical protein
MSVSAVFDGDAVGKTEGIIDIEGSQGCGMAACKWLITIKSPRFGAILIIAVRCPL